MRRALVVLALGALVSAGCGGSSDRGAAGGGDALEVVRSGGIAGVHDVVRVDAGDAATLQRRGGSATRCTVPAEPLARLRAIDLAALSPAPTGAHPLPDAYQYEIRSRGHAVTLHEQRESGRRADALDAAAALVAGCLAPSG